MEAFSDSFVAVAGAGGFVAVGTAAARAGDCTAIDDMVVDAGAVCVGVVDAGVEGAESADLPVGIQWPLAKEE